MSSAKLEKSAKKPKVKQLQEQRLKTVIRRLPPNLPEQLFWQSVTPWVTEETCSWKLFCPGKLRKGSYNESKDNVPSRAYILFKNAESLTAFGREYDGHIFRDKQGNETQVVVEFAPFQKVPSEKKKQDARMGTIEEDPDYISFIESLKTPAEAAPVEPSSPRLEPNTTPLLAALAAEKAAAREREAIQRYHGHSHAMTAAQRQQERQRERLEEEREFSRNPIPGPGDSPMKGSRGNKGGPTNATPSSPAAAGQSPAPGGQSRLNRKQRKDATPATTSEFQTSSPPPSSKSGKPTPINGADADNSSAPSQQKPERRRPTFKFDAAVLAVAVPGSEGKDGKEAPKQTRRNRIRERENDKNDPNSGQGPSSITTTGVAPSPISPPRAPKANRGGHRPRPNPAPAPTPSATVSMGSQASIPAPSTPTAGIIPISISATSHSERGGRGGGRGRGRGRGGRGGPRGGAPSTAS